MTSARKAGIAARFNAAEGYEQAASLQKRCATLLAGRIRQQLARTPPRRVLEFGCGTGLLSRELVAAFPAAEFHLTDLAPAMLERTARQLDSLPTTPRSLHIYALDGEAPQLPSETARNIGPGFDLIASSLCLQWFSDRPRAFRALAGLLRPGGVLMASTLLAGTLQQWRDSCAAASLPCGVPDYPSPATLQQDWPRNGQGSWACETLADPVPSARHFLRGLRLIGASMPREGHRPAAGLRQAMRYFDRHYDHVTYQAGFGLFRRNT